jgi:hypothetical protein
MPTVEDVGAISTIAPAGIMVEFGSPLCIPTILRTRRYFTVTASDRARDGPSVEPSPSYHALKDLRGFEFDQAYGRTEWRRIVVENAVKALDHHLVEHECGEASG